MSDPTLEAHEEDHAVPSSPPHAQTGHPSPLQRTASVAPPFTRREAKDFLVAFVRERNPPVGASVSREEIERLLELSWAELGRKRILAGAILTLAVEPPVMFFRTSEKFGLVRHDDNDGRPTHAFPRQRNGC